MLDTHYDGIGKGIAEFFNKSYCYSLVRALHGLHLVLHGLHCS